MKCMIPKIKREISRFLDIMNYFKDHKWSDTNWKELEEQYRKKHRKRCNEWSKTLKKEGK